MGMVKCTNRLACQTVVQPLGGEQSGHMSQASMTLIMQR